MAINGTINVSALFHDTDGTTSINVVSLRSSDEYTTGKVAIVTGTAGAASISLGEYGETPYRNASGETVAFDSIARLAFAWSGSDTRTISDALTSPSGIVLNSSGGRVAVTDYGVYSVALEISAGTNTGTYTIVLYGT